MYREKLVAYPQIRGKGLFSTLGVESCSKHDPLARPVRTYHQLKGRIVTIEFATENARGWFVTTVSTQDSLLETRTSTTDEALALVTGLVNIGYRRRELGQARNLLRETLDNFIANSKEEAKDRYTRQLTALIGESVNG